jgi:pimeloyl-ACP methyl ester carboxylesterase
VATPLTVHVPQGVLDLRGLGLKWAPVNPKDPEMLWYWKNVERYWMDEGGHFAVHERAAEVAEELGVFLRPLRTST